jgi:S-disulfanyl-L-cysteine oxidoreductase SoxD
MFTPRFACLFPVAGLFLAPYVCATQGPNLGRPLTPDEIRKIDITVSPDGRGLPAGSGSVSAGAAVYAKSCQVCHGEKGAGKPQDQLTGGVGSLASGKPVKTAVSYWPAATTLFDYIRRAMPITSPQSLTNDEVYAVTAYILSIDGIVPSDAVLDAKTLPRVKMPNKDGFVSWWPKPPR